MIKFEHNTLVLNSIFSKDDVKEIDIFADYIRKQEQDRIIDIINDSGMRNYLTEEQCLELIGAINA
jgi:dissimilatory sulfite reductase (desulfoviridin) alpha/beta subunit